MKRVKIPGRILKDSDIKVIRSRKIPEMVVITITGTDPEMLKALRDAVNKQNRIRRARGEEPTPYVINHSSATRPSMAPQSIGPNMPLGSKASTI